MHPNNNCKTLIEWNFRSRKSNCFIPFASVSSHYLKSKCVLLSQEDHDWHAQQIQQFNFIIHPRQFRCLQCYPHIAIIPNCPLFSLVIQWYPTLSNTIQCYPMLPNVIQRYPHIAIIPNCPLFSLVWHLVSECNLRPVGQSVGNSASNWPVQRNSQ